MGIYDRDYYRREGPSVLGNFLEHGRMCKWLIGINIAVFIVQMLTRVPNEGLEVFGLAGLRDGSFTHWLWLDPTAVLHGQLWRLVTYAFLHDTMSVYHILFNMLFLWWFGTDMEDLYGPREFLAYYLGSAAAGGVLYTLTEWAAGGHAPALGASGAVTAVLVLCAIHYPSRIIYLFFVLPVPIWLFVIFSVAMDAYHWIGRIDNGVAVAVHLGGAAFALAYYQTGWRITQFRPSLAGWKQRRRAPQLRVYREEDEQHAQKRQPVSVAASNSPSSLLDDEQLEAKMDAVLEKISRVGKENLTESEKEVLLRASERLKKRRS